MDNRFLAYAKAREVTYWLQTIWLIANLGVCIYLNIWAVDIMHYAYLIAIIVVITIIIFVDWHFLKCVLFMKDHFDRRSQVTP